MNKEESITQHSRGKVSSGCYNSVKGENSIIRLVWYILPNALSLFIMDFALFSSTNTLHSFPTSSTKPGICYWHSLCHCYLKISCQLILGVKITRKLKTVTEMTKLYSYQCWKQEWKVLSSSKEVLGCSEIGWRVTNMHNCYVSLETGKGWKINICFIKVIWNFHHFHNSLLL